MKRAIVCTVENRKQAESIVDQLRCVGVDSADIAVVLPTAIAGIGDGDLTGALVEEGIPAFRAKLFEERLRAGELLIAVQTDDASRRKVKQTLKRNRAHDVSAAF
jgi:hypothetical protein